MFELAYSWFAPQSAHVPAQTMIEEDYEVLDTEEQIAAWFDRPTSVHPKLPMPGFNHHVNKRRAKLSKAQKKARRHFRAMWP